MPYFFTSLAWKGVPLVTEPSFISLSPRLQTLANWVKPQSLLADIGTDHGYLPLYLLQQKRITQAIAADLNKGPLQRAETLSKQYNIPLDLRLCDGLAGISPQEVDTITIAGMGGMTIVHILQQWLEQYPDLPNTWRGHFFLQPMSTQYDLRLWLNTHDFYIEKEETIREGKLLYNTLCVSFQEDSPYSEAELWVGRHRKEQVDPSRRELLAFWKEKTKRALEKLPEQQVERKQELQQRISGFETLEQEISQ